MDEPLVLIFNTGLGIIKVIIAYYFKALPSKGVKHNSQSRRV